jgi:prepilin-type N-terminal cleavage/methylation domain-containing protein
MTCTAESAQHPRPTRSRRARSRRGPARAGFTLIEMIVAVVILTVGLLGLASTSAVITRQAGGNATQTLATQVIANRLEKFRSLGCSQIAPSGGETTRRISERWARVNTVNRVLFVVDTVTYTIAGTSRTKMHVFTITVPCQ